jgi:GNAT superfamily N-acetyltransferase
VPVGDALWDSALPVLQELRPELTRRTFDEIYACAFREGLRYSAALEVDKVVGLAGWRVMTTTYARRKLHIDDLVVTSAGRSQGVGSQLMTHLIERAQKLACTAVDLDSRVHRHSAHRFYLRKRFDISAYHFLLPVPEPGQNLY